MEALTNSRGMTSALVAAALCAACFAAPQSTRAASDDPAPAANRPLPKYFDKLDLTDDQKGQVFKVCDKFNPLIESQAEVAKASTATGDLVRMVGELRALKALKANKWNALWKILNDDQRDKYNELKQADAPLKP